MPRPRGALAGLTGELETNGQLWAVEGVFLGGESIDWVLGWFYGSGYKASGLYFRGFSGLRLKIKEHAGIPCIT